VTAQQLIIKHFEQNIQTNTYAQDMLVEQIVEIGQLCTNVLLSDTNRLFTCGIQLSEVVGQYLSAALLKREMGEKPALPSINLNINSFMQMDTSTDVHGNTLRALAKHGDVLIAFALDGDESTIIETIRVAKELELTVAVVLGQQGYEVSAILGQNDIEVRVPADDDATVIEHQVLISNTFIKLIDSELFGF